MGAAARKQGIELLAHPLARGLREEGCAGFDRRLRFRGDREPELGGEAKRPKQAKRVVLEGVGGDGNQALLREIAQSPGGIDQPPAGRFERERIDGEIPAAQVRLDPFSRGLQNVDRRLAADHAVDGEGGLPDEDRTGPEGAGDSFRKGPRLAQGDQVEIVGGAAEQQVAHAAADQENPLGRGKPGGAKGGGDRRDHGDRSIGSKRAAADPAARSGEASLSTGLGCGP